MGHETSAATASPCWAGETNLEPISRRAGRLSNGDGVGWWKKQRAVQRGTFSVGRREVKQHALGPTESGQALDVCDGDRAAEAQHRRGQLALVIRAKVDALLHGKLYRTCPKTMLLCAALGPVPATQGCRKR